MSRYGSYSSMWAPYVPVAKRRAAAEAEAKKLAKKGQILAPVVVQGRKIAQTFWGRGWCEQLELHSDYANRLPRGRTYVRNGSVIDLQIRPGEVTALVSGSEIYTVQVTVEPLAAASWQALVQDCVGQIDSLVELLQGRLAKGVLARLSHPSTGLLPLQRQMQFDCSCPDGAFLCKHVAAALYGVGHRLDTQPELLFVLRQVDQRDLIARAAVPTLPTQAAALTLDDGDLAGVFGLDLEGAGLEAASQTDRLSSPAAQLAQFPPQPMESPRRQKGQRPVARRVEATPAAPAKVIQAPRAAAKAPPPAAAFVLGVLQEFRDQECSTQDLFDWQTATSFSKSAIAAALLHLRAKGKVAGLKDEASGVIYWRAVD